MSILLISKATQSTTAPYKKFTILGDSETMFIASRESCNAIKKWVEHRSSEYLGSVSPKPKLARAIQTPRKNLSMYVCNEGMTMSTAYFFDDLISQSMNHPRV
jgi:hypothetical protein